MSETSFTDPSKIQEQSLMDVESDRATQEVQAQLVIAKKFPRDYQTALKRINQACQDRDVAKSAEYTYPRGNTEVRGPSIRLAEVVGQLWGNFESGVTELSQGQVQGQGYSDVMSYAWDLETNTRDVKKFRVSHTRHTKQGSYPLKDPRDIYEMVANMAARRKRACIMAVIPKAVFDAAVTQCRLTLQGAEQTRADLPTRIAEMKKHFSQTLSVTIESLETYLGHPLEFTTEDELTQLRGIVSAITDGIAKVADYFEVQQPQQDQSTADKLRAREQPAAPPPEEAAAPAPPPPQAPAAQDGPPPWQDMRPPARPDGKGGTYPVSELDKIFAWMEATKGSRGVDEMSRLFHAHKDQAMAACVGNQSKALWGKFGGMGGIKEDELPAQGQSPQDDPPF